ncbi:MAG TPA: radical SAM protein [Acidimicrobiia bacterium]|nr:radical SAM protein [Acidimicrobiia bacterium]
MRVLLVSTYELGRQPIHVASPAAALRAAGHEVRSVDLAVGELTSTDVDWADRLAVSVPMHTATRLADQVVGETARVRPHLPIAVYGLYAGVASAEVAARFEGEYEPALLEWVQDGGMIESRHLGKSSFVSPDRSGLPGLADYARLETGGRTVLAGAVEASHGCRHRCRHCPIPSVYDGRIRIVPKEEVLADIDNLVAAGAGHITFGDADFLNAPAHSLDILERAHAAHPHLTFDATIKVEHILAHRDLWDRLAALNLLFVVSAFESVDQQTLDILDKGHDVSDMTAAVGLLRAAGIHIRPTWLPFMPWTSSDDVASIFEFVATHDLAGATDPVQMSIRLLIPKGSLLEEHPAVTPHLTAYDQTALTWRWFFADPDAEVMQKELETIASDASDCGQEAATTLNEMRDVVSRIAGRRLPEFDQTDPVPRLTESWFCCAEPTEGQSVTIRIGSR